MNFLNKEMNICQIGKFLCSLELAPWSIEKITNELIIPQNKHDTPSKKLSFLAQALIHTPFFYESCLPILEKGVMRVRFTSFDCTTFIYTIIALCNAKSFEHFVTRLYQIRYHANDSLLVDNHPSSGNMYDFVNESLLVNAIDIGMLENITDKVCSSPDQLVGVQVNIQPFKRPKKFDQNELVVTPKIRIGNFAEHFILTSKLNEVNLDCLQSGDLAILTQGTRFSSGMDNPSLVNHLVTLIRLNNEIYFIHSSMSFFMHLSRDSNLLRLGTGVYYDDKKQMEQAGVNFGGEFMGDDYTITVEGTRCFAYAPNSKRTFSSYAKDIFFGVIFLRPIDC